MSNILSNQQSTFLFFLHMTKLQSTQTKHVKNILTHVYDVWHDTWILNFYTGV